MDEETKKEFEKVWDEINKLKKEKIEILPPKLEEKRDTKIDNLCEEIGITKENFDSLFFIKEKEILLLIVPSGNEGKKQLQVTLCLLTLQDYLFDSDFIKSKDLNAKLKRLGIGSLANLSTNLKKEKQFLIPEGKQGDTNFGFRVTIPGKTEGKKIIKELVGK